MNLTVNNPLYDRLELFLRVLNELTNNLNFRKPVKVDFYYYKELRENRKLFEKTIRNTLKKFHSLPENQQVEIEIQFYRALKESEILVPKAIEELKKDNIFLFSYFLIKEVNKTMNIFRYAQKQMSSFLYPDTSKELLSNPELYRKLAETWGDLAEDGY